MAVTLCRGIRGRGMRPIQKVFSGIEFNQPPPPGTPRPEAACLFTSDSPQFPQFYHLFP